MIPLVVTATAGPVDAEPVSVLQCVPISCAADYIGVSAGPLTTIADEFARTSGKPGIEVVIELLDLAERSKLDVLGRTGDGATQVAAGADIVQRHDDLRTLLLSQARDGVLPPG